MMTERRSRLHAERRTGVSSLTVALVLFLLFGSFGVHAVAFAGTPPSINVWYGNDQRFGAVGTPQRWANILGNVSHPSGINQLWYNLNGGSNRSLSFAADSRRLARAGDFNIDLRYAELNQGVNTVVITALANSGDMADTTIIVRNQSGSFWPLPYTLAWSSLTDSAQIVDGKWTLNNGGARLLEPGYDRLIAIGDTTWNSYEVTVKVTVHGLDEDSATGVSYNDVNGGPAVGIIMRWKGHTNTPTFNPPVAQPLTGYLPFGSIVCYHWRNGGSNPQPNQWEEVIADGSNLTVPATSTQVPLYFGAEYFFKVQVTTLPGTGHQYRSRFWQAGTDEPSTWLMSATAPTSGLGNGSFLLMAHHVYATFGAVTVTPLSDGVSPALANIASAPTATTARITWTTDEPATGSVAYGLTGGYGSATSDLTNYVKSHSLLLEGLEPSTTYHYAVISADWGGSSSTSTDFMFQTAVLTPPPQPVLAFPGDGSVDQPTALTLGWTKALNAAGYRVQLGTDPTFSSGVLMDDANVTDTVKATSGLLAGTRYYWRVNAHNNAGESPFSSVRSFITAVDIPVLASPANGSWNTLPSPRLAWRRVPGATSYRVWVSTDSSLASAAVLDDSLIVDTSRVVTGLQLGQKYYWRVRAKNSLVIGAFSSAWSFTPAIAPPTLLSPAQGSSNQLLNPTLRWASVPLAGSYDVQLGTDSTFASGIVVFDSLLADTSRAVSGLMPGTAYFWRARTRNASGPGAYTTTWSFSTGLSAAQLLSPADGSSGQPLSITFLWGKVDRATSYAFQLATDSTFGSGLVKNDASLADTSRFVAGLSYKTTLYWHVRPRQGTVNGPWSPTWKVTTLVRLPGAVALLEPENGAMIPPDSARFTWTRALPNASRYWLEVALDTLFALTRIDSTLTDTTSVVHNLSRGSTFYWRVKGGTIDGWGPFSETRHITMGTVDVAGAEEGMPGAFALNQNYPNPFNPSTQIHFALPKESHVRLEVYNILGELVATVLNEQMQAGFHRIEFSARDDHGRALAAGMYIYRMQTPEFTQAKKMILLK